MHGACYAANDCTDDSACEYGGSEELATGIIQSDGTVCYVDGWVEALGIFSSPGIGRREEPPDRRVIPAVVIVVKLNLLLHGLPVNFLGLLRVSVPLSPDGLPFWLEESEVAAPIGVSAYPRLMVLYYPILAENPDSLFSLSDPLRHLRKDAARELERKPDSRS